MRCSSRIQCAQTVQHAPKKGTGLHRYEADFHIVIMLTGWARFMYLTYELRG